MYILTALKGARPEQLAESRRIPAGLLRAGNAASGKCRERFISPIRSQEDPTVKLLRTIRLDASDTFVFEEPAEPGEWAVSGAFAFASCNPAGLHGKARTAFRAGFLGLTSLGRSSLVQIVDAHETDRREMVGMLAAHLVARFGAPDLATARLAAEEETSFAASLCDHPPGVLVAVTRSHDNGTIREVFRTLRPRIGIGHASAFEFIEVVGEDVPLERFDLTAPNGGAAR
jgi:hypothetical protein